EVARRVADVQKPVHLFVSASQPPHTHHEPARHELSRAELIGEIRRLGGVQDEMLASDELMDLVLPILRADFEAASGYRFHGNEPPDLPIPASAGSAAPGVGPAAMSGWRCHPRRAFGAHVIGGGLFFFYNRPDELARRVVRALSMQPFEQRV